MKTNPTSDSLNEAIDLLCKLISTPSFSKQEDQTADIIANLLTQKRVSFKRLKNNVWAKNLWFDAQKPTILLNSHHDTVRPNSGYTKDPFAPIQENGRLYGLGSNDAGGALVCLIFTFLHFYRYKNLPFNLALVASAEEENSGADGVAIVLPLIPNLKLGIVGEPTGMNAAITEKGLLVLDCTTHGIAGHAARDLGDNAISKAMKEIEWINNYKFEKVSELLGPVRMSVTMIEGGYQHNIIPDKCKFVIDIRTTDAYTAEQIMDIISKNISSDLQPRSFRLKPSAIRSSHPAARGIEALGGILYGSPTTSDQALMDFDTIKIGPGLSERSHTADEYIEIEEIVLGLGRYQGLIDYLIIHHGF